MIDDQISNEIQIYLIVSIFYWLGDFGFVHYFKPGFCADFIDAEVEAWPMQIKLALWDEEPKHQECC